MKHCGAPCFLLYQLMVVALDIYALAQGQETCSEPTISYSTDIYPYSDSSETHLTCSITSPQWWTSTAPCGPFTKSTLCPTRSNLCVFNTTMVGDLFYHCCTSGEPVEDSLAEVSVIGNCIRIEICTTIIDAETSHAPPYAILGKAFMMYVKVHSHPQPIPDLTVMLNSTSLNGYEVSAYQPVSATPLFLFEFSVPIPSEQEYVGILLFLRASFSRTCPNAENTHVVSTADVIGDSNGAGSEPATSTHLTTGLMTPTTSGTMTNTCASKGIMAAMVVLGVLLGVVLVILVLGVIAFAVCYKRLSKSNQAQISSSSSSDRPHTLGISPNVSHNYNRIESHDSSPYPPPGHPSPSAQQQNGTPSNLATPTFPLGHAQNSHTGGTPLIALTPADSFPNAASSRGLPTPAPPSYSQVQGTVLLSDEVSSDSAIYTTVGGSGTGGTRQGRGVSPSEGGYSNSTALGLGNNIQLPGAEPATDV